MVDMVRQEEEEFGKDHGLLHEVVVTGRKVGAMRAFWSKLAHDEDLFRKVVELVEARTTLSVVVDYDLPFNGMVEAGKYDLVDKHIKNEYFPGKRGGDKDLTIELFHFNRVMEANGVLPEIDREGCRPVTIEELLALGKQHPEEQRKYPIVSFGSVWRSHRGGNRCVSYLWGHDRGRYLSLDGFDSGWDDDVRFAAVRKAN